MPLNLRYDTAEGRKDFAARADMKGLWCHIATESQGPAHVTGTVRVMSKNVMAGLVLFSLLYAVLFGGGTLRTLNFYE